MIPLQIHNGLLVNNSGRIVTPDAAGMIEVNVEGEIKRYVYEKLIDYIKRNGQVYKKPILSRNKPIKIASNKKVSTREKKGNVGEHRRKAIVVSKDDIEEEFKSIKSASKKLGICYCNMFRVLNGERSQIGGYKIKYK